MERDESALGMDDGVETMLLGLLSDGIDFSLSALANAEAKIVTENRATLAQRFALAKRCRVFSPTFTFPPRFSKFSIF